MIAPAPVNTQVTDAVGYSPFSWTGWYTQVRGGLTAFDQAGNIPNQSTLNFLNAANAAIAQRVYADANSQLNVETMVGSTFVNALHVDNTSKVTIPTLIAPLTNATQLNVTGQEALSNGAQLTFRDPTSTWFTQRLYNNASLALILDTNGRTTAGGADSWVNVLQIGTNGIATLPFSFLGTAQVTSNLTLNNGVSLSLLNAGNSLQTQRLYSDGSGQLTLDSNAGPGWVNALRVGTDASVKIADATKLSIGSNWQSWTPTLTAGGSMTLSAINLAQCLFFRLGNVVHFQLYVTVTLGGTASNLLAFTLPLASYSTSLPQGVQCSIAQGNWTAGFGYVQESHLYVFLNNQANYSLISTAIMISGTYRIV